ncbi:hypothetical protein [Kitasatospora cineracea]|uniref:hypothetical protein n=1 Tax=Kitasatospora cineracea TaxID=88074 RepID=UPI0038298552
MNGTHPTSGRPARSARLACAARRLGYRVRALSWTALCALCTLLGPATTVDD